MHYSMFVVIVILSAHINAQVCDEEVTDRGISVRWHRSPPANNVVSDPLCYNNGYLITRDCGNTCWIPSAPKLKPCLQVVKHYDLLACPPGFDKISENNLDYCYQINDMSPWSGPCFKSGGAPLITELSEDDLSFLLHSLRTKNISNLFWLPARRIKTFNPVKWYIPGPKWGLQLEPNNSLSVQASILKNCLLIDIERKLIVTEACSKQHPSLCFYINEMHYPAKCPKNYHAFRFMPDDGLCYGIEHSIPPLTFDEFLLNKCSNPMDDGNNRDLNRFIYKRIAVLNNIPNDVWCWYSRTNDILYNTHILYENISMQNDIDASANQTQVIINNVGTLSLLSSKTLTRLPCMACVTEMVYENTELMFEYSAEEDLIYLIVYSPSGLWKYNKNDRGVQCFSNANGFVSVIVVSDLPFIEQTFEERDKEFPEKVVYVIHLVTDRSAQYWCEGHTKNFSLIRTEKLVVNPNGNKEHVFTLALIIFLPNSDIDNLDNLMENVRQNVNSIFSVKKALLMDILEYSMNNLLVQFHLHVEVDDKYENDSLNIVSVYQRLKAIAKDDLVKYNYTFVNISSAFNCLPTTSVDNLLILDWEMTLIGHIAAPTQFCLQANGLPVKRLCSGTYLHGSIWGNVEGSCDKNYVASKTTAFLYNFVKGQVQEDDVSRFLTDGLGFVLSDIGLIIPADIYYLSMSLKHILSIAQINHTSVDFSDIDNIAWVMDRILSLDNSYLRLAQTLNSTNIILDSINDIIEILSFKNITIKRSLQNDCKTLAIQPQCVIHLSYPDRNNISGIAIINNKLEDDFVGMEVKSLYRNTTLDDVLSIKNLEIAAWIPDEVLNSLERDINKTDNGTIDNKKLNIIITVFHNDAIFQELENNNHVVNSRLIGISIPGFNLNFNSFVPLVFRDLTQSNSEKFCGYWDFKVHKRKNVFGSWSKSGCFLEKTFNDITVCKCYHLTHFSQLLNIRNSKYENRITETHTRALNIITLIGSFLSLLGIACIWITACVFQTWRKKAGTKVLMHFSISIVLPLLFMVIFNLDNTIFGKHEGVYAIYDHMRAICIVLGALLHYSVLASFMWMLITAILQFIRYVRVLGVRRPSRFMLKLTLIGWGIPLIPVLIVLYISKENYIPDMTNCYKCAICYPKGIYLILSVVLPVCVILLVNITLFIIVLWSVSKGPDGKFRSTDSDLISTQLRLSIFLFFLLGLTWIFGFLSFSNQLIWSYLFCLTSSLQGFVLFVYFIVCDPNTRNLWVTLMKSQYRPRQPRESISSITSG